MPGGQKEDTGGFEVKHHALDLAGGSGSVELNTSNILINIGDFNFDPPDFSWDVPPGDGEPETTPPEDPSYGDIFVDVTNNVMYFFDGDTWQSFGVLPSWFTVSAEDSNPHEVVIDGGGSDLSLKLRALPTSDPGDDGVWLSPT